MVQQASTKQRRPQSELQNQKDNHCNVNTEHPNVLCGSTGHFVSLAVSTHREAVHHWNEFSKLPYTVVVVLLIYAQRYTSHNNAKTQNCFLHVGASCTVATLEMI